MGKYAENAKALFKEGYNCSQAVFLAFRELTDVDDKTAALIASSFGGGMGRMREVCGAVTGMFMVAGLLWGYNDPKAREPKATHYALIQELAGEFRAECGSIVCRELLGGGADTGSVPTERTVEFYKKRPCAELVGLAAHILEKHLEKDGVNVL